MNYLFFLLLACQDKSYTNPDKAAPEVPGNPSQVRSDESASMKTIIAEYERLRLALVKDSLDGLEEACDRIISASKVAERFAPDQIKPKYTQLSAKAALLRQASTADMEGARQLFGDLSRPLIEILRSDELLSKDLYIFECPMAQDYSFWVQKTKGIENPYMGSKMLSCGAAATW